MAVRSDDLAANGRGVVPRFLLREVATLVGVVFAATGVLIAGMQWAISNNVDPLFLLMRAMQSQVLDIRDDVGELRAEVGVLRGQFAEVRGEVGEVRGEVGELRGQVTDIRERVARVEAGLEQVRGNQARVLDLLERGLDPSE